MIESDTFAFRKSVEKFRVDIKMLRSWRLSIFILPYIIFYMIAPIHSLCETHTHTQNYGVNIAFFKFMFGTGLGLLQFLWLILWPIFIEQVDETCTKTYKGWPMTICFWIFCVSCLDFNISRLLRSKKDIQFTNLWRDQNKKKTNDEHKAMSKWLIDLVIANHQVS